ncbi:YggS family pyridoxal phosphate-dependent enzyme [Mesobacillus maritimus]|uniref:YggS family pyridoxal phosphate-dependent enzyme n=1 Tax=Mesobacillus maritimus TaxID=1643336 RepID=UPI002040BD53|nr:YggS family pyridoxal phosphate-dependent enzyme [Mesobacillus maritimus]MCM3587108.1 YggS family pyridoxal phosphate-dependent enzyme [Mesobacillus maritimus]MCM3667673.1 YggS family pyridoxal phosphate-dependent enzyme [Mesobacillus maritimus]
MRVEDNLRSIQANIEHACKVSGRQPSEVKIIAVTKYVSVERAKEAVEAGIVHLGENRDEGLLNKWEHLKDKPIWHYIGTLQTRKVKNVMDKIDYLHSLDRLSLAKEVNKRATKKVKCFVQVNVSGEESKHGLNPGDVLEFVKDLAQFENIQVEGLMTMAPYTEDELLLRRCFQNLKSLQHEVQQLHLDYAPCNELSMGMSNDYQIAVEEGATMVRIGTALVGEKSEV